jgi:hypothetical protein
MNWGQAAYNWGQLGRYASQQIWNSPTGRGAVFGAGAGALWGMASSNTSVLGGMAIGAGMGAFGGRYGTIASSDAALGWRTTRGMGFGSRLKQGAVDASGGFMHQLHQDMQGPRLMANQAINGITSYLKGWGA